MIISISQCFVIYLIERISSFTVLHKRTKEECMRITKRDDEKLHYSHREYVQIMNNIDIHFSTSITFFCCFCGEGNMFINIITFNCQNIYQQMFVVKRELIKKGKKQNEQQSSSRTHQKQAPLLNFFVCIE